MKFEAFNCTVPGHEKMVCQGLCMNSTCPKTFLCQECMINLGTDHKHMASDIIGLTKFLELARKDIKNLKKAPKIKLWQNEGPNGRNELLKQVRNFRDKIVQQIMKCFAELETQIVQYDLADWVANKLDEFDQQKITYSKAEKIMKDIFNAVSFSMESEYITITPKATLVAAFPGGFKSSFISSTNTLKTIVDNFIADLGSSGYCPAKKNVSAVTKPAQLAKVSKNPPKTSEASQKPKKKTNKEHRPALESNLSLREEKTTKKSRNDFAHISDRVVKNRAKKALPSNEPIRSLFGEEEKLTLKKFKSNETPAQIGLTKNSSLPPVFTSKSLNPEEKQMLLERNSSNTSSYGAVNLADRTNSNMQDLQSALFSGVSPLIKPHKLKPADKSNSLPIRNLRHNVGGDLNRREDMIQVEKARPSQDKPLSTQNGRFLHRQVDSLQPQVNSPESEVESPKPQKRSSRMVIEKQEDEEEPDTLEPLGLIPEILESPEMCIQKVEIQALTFLDQMKNSEGAMPVLDSASKQRDESPLKRPSNAFFSRQATDNFIVIDDDD